MSESDVYDNLAEKMSNWPVRSPMSKELRKILEKLYTPEEADLLLVFNGPYLDQFTAKNIAKKLKKPVEEIQPILDKMAHSQRIFNVEKNCKRTYSMFPMLPGLFEFYFANHKRAKAEEKEVYYLFAEEFEKYYDKGFVSEVGSSSNPFMRVFLDQQVIDKTVETGKGKFIDMAETITNAVKNDILPFEQAKNFIIKARKVGVMDCACRTHMKSLNDEKPVNKYPINVCMMFNTWADYAEEQEFGRVVTKEEALEILTGAAKAGLVHTTQNMTGKSTFICNCDRDCCVMLKGITKFRNPNMVASSNFLPEYNKNNCTFCEKCVNLCPMRAIQHHFGHNKNKSDQKIMINLDLCIGCGVCAFNCPKDALVMVKKFTDIPPQDAMEAAQKFVEGRIH